MQFQMKDVGIFYGVSNLGEEKWPKKVPTTFNNISVHYNYLFHSDYVSDISSIMMIADVP